MLRIILWGALLFVTGCERLYNTNLIRNNDFAFELTEKINQRNKDKIIVYERDEELATLQNHLKGSYNNNTILIGKSGVGKTSLVNEFARQMVAGKVVSQLVNKKIVQIDLARIKATAAPSVLKPNQYFELVERAKLSFESDTIYFIDHFDVVLTNDMVENEEFGDLLKQYLEDNEVTIVAITPSTYVALGMHRYDLAIRNRVRNLIIKETDLVTTENILNSLRPKMESEYGIEISDKSLKFASRLGILMIDYKASPYSAIAILDFAANQAQIEQRNILDDHLVLATSFYSLKTTEQVRQKFLLAEVDPKIYYEDSTITRNDKTVAKINKMR